MDGSNIPFADIERNMQELDTINRLLGGHQITIRGVEKILESVSDKSEVYHIVELGSGGGDNLRVLKKWAQKHSVNAYFTGIDINAECVAFAKSQPQNKGIQFICSDYKTVVFPQPPHIIFSSLFCHHFSHDELVQMMQWKFKNATSGFFINDLQRHPLAYHSIKLLTTIFSKSYLVKNDAPLSVLRGFSKEEWQDIFKEAGITNFTISWQWAFRWLLTCVH